MEKKKQTRTDQQRKTEKIFKKKKEKHLKDCNLLILRIL